MKALSTLYDRHLPSIIFFFTIFVFVLGILFVLKAPPITGIDEDAHFKRAVQIAQGEFFPTRFGRNDYGGVQDNRLFAYEEWYHGHFLHAPNEKLLRSDAKALSKTLTRTPRQLVTSHFPSTASFAPTPYLPQALGLWVGRVLHMTIDNQFLAGRMAVLIVYVIGMFAIATIIPRFKLLTLCLLTTPTALHVATSYSADPISNLLAALFVAFWLRLFLQTPARPYRRSEKLTLLTLGTALALTKIPFSLLLLLVLFLPGAKWSTRRHKWLARGLVFLVPLLLAMAWNLVYPFAPGKYWGSGGDPVVTLKLFLHQPVTQISILFYDAYLNAWPWWKDGFSRFCTGPSPVYYEDFGVIPWLGAAAILCLIVADRGGAPNRWAGLILFLLGIAFCILNLLAFKIGFAAPGSLHTWGIQGRYFVTGWLYSALGLGLMLPNMTALRRFSLLCLALHMFILLQATQFMIRNYAALWM